jgi:hypothetical protein
VVEKKSGYLLTLVSFILLVLADLLLYKEVDNI